MNVCMYVCMCALNVNVFLRLFSMSVYVYLNEKELNLLAIINTAARCSLIPHSSVFYFRRLFPLILSQAELELLDDTPKLAQNLNG